MYQSFSHRVGYIKEIHHTCSFVYDDVHECSKRTYFHLLLKYIYFLHFRPWIFLIISLLWHRLLATNWKKKCNLVQFWFVITSMMGFNLFNYTKNPKHYIIIPGGPCTYEDTTGWGLINREVLLDFIFYNSTLQYNDINGLGLPGAVFHLQFRCRQPRYLFIHNYNFHKLDR